MSLLIEKFGKIDCLVNNAANNPKIEKNISKKNFSRLENFPLDIWYQDLNVGLTGSLLCSKYYGYQISKNSNGGSIVNISSTSSQDCNIGRSAYSSSKIALEAMTKTLAYELGRYNIRANCVLPGLTNTKLMKENTNESVLSEVVKNIALGRIAEPEEIANLVSFLCSSKSSYITGQSIRVDGGLRI